MKRRGILLILISLLVTMLLGGCGTKMYELTAEEEDLIAQYAAYTLAKYNTFQKDGAKAMPDTAGTQSPELAETQMPEEDTTADGMTPDAISPDQTMESGEAGSTSLGEITLAEAMGYEGLDVSYDGFFLTDSYKEGKHYAVDAKQDNTFVVMQFTATNTTNQDIAVDMLARQASYRANLDGTGWITEDVTLLLYDMSSYQGTVPAGESVELVLLFQTKADSADAITDISLAVSEDGAEHTIIL